MREIALRLLARRDYTTHELRRKVVERGYDAAVIDSLIESLTSAGALDDRRVAGAHARTAAGVKGRGRIRIARELAARGIARSVIDDVLRTIESQDEAASITRILTRRKWPKHPTLADRRRMFQHLLRRGFKASEIRVALGKSSAGAELEHEDD